MGKKLGLNEVQISPRNAHTDEFFVVLMINEGGEIKLDDLDSLDFNKGELEVDGYTLDSNVLSLLSLVLFYYGAGTKAENVTESMKSQIFS